jgi:hypothetical protein
MFRFPVALLVALVASVFFVLTGPELGHRILSDPDIWWHLRNAEYLVNTGHFLRQDLYSFTMHGHAWIDPEWLSELPYYLAWRGFGERGLFLVLTAATEAIILGVFYLSYLRTGNVKSAFVAAWLAILLASVSFGPRTVLFGWICLVIELIVLWKFRHGENLLWALPPLFAVWINLHGSWVIGIVFLLIYIGAGCIQASWGGIIATRWTRSDCGKLSLVTVLSVAALFLNPYGWRLVAYPFDYAFRLKLNIGMTEEWQSLDFHSGRGKFTLLVLAVMLLLNLLRRRSWPVTEVLFGALAIYSALTYIRFLALAAIVLCPLIASDLSFISPYRRDRERRAFNALVILGLAAMVFVRFPSQTQLRETAARNYPSQARAYLAAFHPQGRLINDYNWGGYLIWNARQIPVFIDSRVDIFEHEGILADYLAATNLHNTLEILDKHAIRYVLFPKTAPIAYMLRHLPAWKTDYDDGSTILLERATAQPRN